MLQAAIRVMHEERDSWIIGKGSLKAGTGELLQAKLAALASGGAHDFSDLAFARVVAAEFCA